jgi:hypothetical protein
MVAVMLMTAVLMTMVLAPRVACRIISDAPEEGACFNRCLCLNPNPSGIIDDTGGVALPSIAN